MTTSLHRPPGDRPVIRRSSAGGMFRRLLPWAAAAALVVLAPGTASAQDGEVIGGVSVDEVVAGVADDGVAVIGSGADPAALSEQVQRARSANVGLSVVSLGRSLLPDEAARMCALVSGRIGGGTVLVLSPDGSDLCSAELSETRQQDAEAAVRSGGTDDLASTRAMVDSLTATGFPWLLVGGVALVVGILGAVGLGVWRRHRAREADTERLTDLLDGLRRRHAALASDVLGLTQRVELAGRPDLEVRVDRASADYSVLGQALTEPPASRGAVDRAAADLSDLDRRLGVLDAELDALMPGLEPPSPAG